MNAELMRRTAAVLAADVAGYSRLMAEDAPGTVAMLDDSRALFRERIGAHHGRVVDMAGDSVLALFDGACDAVQSALSVQAELAAANQRREERRRMRYRVGVHLGEILQKEDGTAYGDGVNIAARLESLAEAGGITVSAAVVDAVRGAVAVEFLDQGEQIVKNIPYPVHAFRWVTADLQTPFGALPHPVALPRHPSLAVLPFVNLGGDPEQEYFADGIAEDLTTALSRLRWLNVIARGSAFAYKGRTLDVREIGKLLAARYVLEGSLRRSGERIRVSCRLIDASNGNQLWSERYERTVAQTFELQDEIALTLAGTIAPELSKAEQERALRKPAESMDAWDLYHRALWHFWKYTPQAHAEARRLLQAAVATDPNFAPAHSQLALSYFSSFVNGFDSAPNSFTLACEAASRALAVDEKDAMARFVLGRVYTQTGQLQAAIAQLRAAVELNPSFAQAHYGLGLALLSLDRWEEAIESCATAERLSPHDPMLQIFQAIRANALCFGGRLEEAEIIARKALQHPTASFWNIATLASVLGHAGRLDEARETMARLLAARPDFSPALMQRIMNRPTRSEAEGPPLRAIAHFSEGLYLAGLPRPAGRPPA